MSMDLQFEEPARPKTSSPFSDAHDTISETPTEGTGYTPNESGPQTPMTDGEPKMAPEQSSMKTYQPYDIEEPDEDVDATVRRLDLRLPDSFERWQRDLADHVDDGTSAHAPLAKQVSSPRRGQKRKSTSAPAGAGHCSTSPSSYRAKPGSLDDDALPVPGLNSKRRRRRTKLVDDSAKMAPVVSLHDFRDPEMNESSSSDVWSTDESADTMHDYTATDDMDLD